MAQNELKQRKNVNRKKLSKDEKKSQPKASQTSNGAAPTPATSAEPETLWQTFTSHPFVAAAPYFIAVYLLWTSTYFFSLKRPDILKGLIPLRPAVQMDDKRQVLILGAIGSGTQQVAESLSKVMNLEIKREGLNSLQLFTRDGAVSNFLGIRYAEKSGNQERIVKMISNTCVKTGKSASGSVFDLRNYKPTNCWPWPIDKEACHQKECLEFMGKELGCALDEEGACPTPFARVIHLVQHPIHVLQQLIPKVCPGDAKAVHPAFRQMAGVFIEDDSESCIATMSWYFVEFNRALLEARGKGYIDAMVQYETSTLCDLATIAGFTNPELAVYPPNVDRVIQTCAADDKADVHKPLPHLETKTDAKNIKLPDVNWDSFDEAGGPKLVNALKELCKDLGYDPDAPLDTGSRYVWQVEQPAATTIPKQTSRNKNELPPGEVY